MLGDTPGHFSPTASRRSSEVPRTLWAHSRNRPLLCALSTSLTRSGRGRAPGAALRGPRGALSNGGPGRFQSVTVATLRARSGWESQELSPCATHTCANSRWSAQRVPTADRLRRNSSGCGRASQPEFTTPLRCTLEVASAERPSRGCASIPVGHATRALRPERSEGVATRGSCSRRRLASRTCHTWVDARTGPPVTCDQSENGFS